MQSAWELLTVASAPATANKLSLNTNTVKSSPGVSPVYKAPAFHNYRPWAPLLFPQKDHGGFKEKKRTT